jgi:hypothetical protein
MSRLIPECLARSIASFFDYKSAGWWSRMSKCTGQLSRSPPEDNRVSIMRSCRFQRFWFQCGTFDPGICLIGLRLHQGWSVSFFLKPYIGIKHLINQNHHVSLLYSTVRTSQTANLIKETLIIWWTQRSWNSKRHWEQYKLNAETHKLFKIQNLY